MHSWNHCAELTAFSCLAAFTGKLAFWLVSQTSLFTQGTHQVNVCCFSSHCHVQRSVLNSTHHPILAAQLLILSASTFLTPDFPLLVPVACLSLAPLHGLTFLYLSNRNPLWALPEQTLKHLLFLNNRPTCHFFRSALLSSSALCLFLLSVYVACKLNCV